MGRRIRPPLASWIVTRSAEAVGLRPGEQAERSRARRRRRGRRAVGGESAESEPTLPGMEGGGRDPFSLAELVDRETAVGLLSQPSAPEDFQGGIGRTRHGLTPEDERGWSVLQAIRPHKTGYFERLPTRIRTSSSRVLSTSTSSGAFRIRQRPAKGMDFTGRFLKAGATTYPGPSETSSPRSCKSPSSPGQVRGPTDRQSAAAPVRVGLPAESKTASLMRRQPLAPPSASAAVSVIRTPS